MKHTPTVFMINLVLHSFLITEVGANGYQIDNSDSNNQQSKYVTFGNAKNPPRHKNNTVEWFYNPIKQNKSIFTEEETIDIIKRSMRSWSDVSGIKYAYQGKTNNSIHNTADGIITIGYWSENAFISEYGDDSSYTQIEWTDSDINEGFIILNSGNQNISSVPSNLNELQGLITHQIGHLLALDHSDVEESIMYANPFHSYEYQTILRNDDIKAASLLYPSDHSCCPTTTVSSNLDINIQSATYQPTISNSRIWATLEFKGKDAEGDLIWKLKNYGND